MVDSDLAILNRILNDEVPNDRDNWGILYHVNYYHPDAVLYYTSDVQKMRNKIIKLLAAYYKDDYSFYMPNIILFRVFDINPQLVTLDLLERSKSEYYYIIKHCKFNKTINHEVPFLIGVFAGVIKIMVDYAFMFERNVSRRRLIAFYKEKTGIAHVKWYESVSSIRFKLVKCKYNEICRELERINV
jgi:hypothetical protein